MNKRLRRRVNLKKEANEETKMTNFKLYGNIKLDNKRDKLGIYRASLNCGLFMFSSPLTGKRTVMEVGR
jgi:hypothetical protein